MAFILQQKTGARAYLVANGQDHKQITLPLRVVNGLKNFNTGNLRHDRNTDKKFIKVLLVACIGVVKVKANQMDPLTIDFIKGNLNYSNICIKLKLTHSPINFISTDLFTIRCDERSIDYEEIVRSSCMEL